MSDEMGCTGKDRHREQASLLQDRESPGKHDTEEEPVPQPPEGHIVR